MMDEQVVLLYLGLVASFWILFLYYCLTRD